MKNYPLAAAAVDRLPDVELLEFKGFTRDRANALFNAVDVLLLTSFRKAAPMVIKEAMACGCPIVATDVGDIRAVVADTAGCHVVAPDADGVAEALGRALAFEGRTTRGERMQQFSLDATAAELERIFTSVLERN